MRIATLGALVVVSAPGLLACTEDAREPRSVPRLENRDGVDPELLARIDQVLATGEAGTDPAWMVELAMVYDANGLWRYALETYELCLRDHPERAELWFHRARMLAELSQPEEALASIGRCIELRDDYAPAHWRRGTWLEGLGRLQGAAEAFREATELEPDGAAGWLGLARIALQRGDPDEAIAVLSPLVQRDPRTPFANGLLARAYRMAGDARKADAALRREERSDEPRLDDPWTAQVMSHAVGLLVELERAGGALADGDPRTALTVLEPLHRERPDELSVVELLARALIQSGQDERALEVLAEARRDHPDNYLLELDTGRALLGQEQSAQAIPHLERAVELNPSYGEGQVALGETLFTLERFGEAEKALARGIELGERQIRTWILLSRAQNRQGAPERAIATLGEGLEEYPNAVDLWAYLADAQVRAGRADDARESLERVERRAPDHPLLGSVRQRLQALDEDRTGG